MKLYIQQKVFSWNDRFTVWDESGQERFFVEGELFSWGKRLHIMDTLNSEVALIQEKVWSWLPRYFVHVGDQQVAEIVKEFTFFRPKYTISGLDWEVNGDFWAHDYEIIHNRMPIVRIHKEWMTWGDCYELDIADSQDEIIALAVVLAIDAVLAKNDN